MAMKVFSQVMIPLNQNPGFIFHATHSSNHLSITISTQFSKLFFLNNKAIRKSTLLTTAYKFMTVVY